MSLVKCHECGQKISTEAATCPQCGAPKREVPKGQKTSVFTKFMVVVFALFLMFVLGDFGETESPNKLSGSEDISTLRAAAATKFKNEKIQILKEIQDLLNNKEFELALRKTSAFAFTSDPDLLELHSMASLEVNKVKAAKEIAQLLGELKDIPVSEFSANRDRYKRLVELSPNSQEYTDKYSFYQGEIDQREAIAAKKKAAEEKKKLEARLRLEATNNERVAKFGDRPIQSAWDGSYSIVETYLKRVANDPESIELDGCTEVYYSDSGWLIGCDYRGRNAFGGMIRQSNWFTVVYGRVVIMHDADAYNL